MSSKFDIQDYTRWPHIGAKGYSEEARARVD